jgi:hypothetical protein
LLGRKLAVFGQFPKLLKSLLLGLRGTAKREHDGYENHYRDELQGFMDHFEEWSSSYFDLI